MKISALILAAALAAFGCGRAAVPVTTAASPPEVLVAWRESAPRGEAVLVLAGYDPYLGGARSEWPWLDEKETAIARAALDEGVARRVIWAAPYTLTPWSLAQAGGYIDTRVAGARNIRRVEYGVAFEVDGTDVLLTDLDGLRAMPPLEGKVLAHADASYFAHAHLSFAQRQRAREDVPSPSALAEAVARHRPAGWTILSRVRAVEPALMLSGEASVLALETILRGKKSEVAAAHDILLRASGLGLHGGDQATVIFIPKDGDAEAVVMARAVEAIHAHDPETAARAARTLAERDSRFAALRERIGEYFFHFSAPEKCAAFYAAWDGGGAESAVAPPQSVRAPEGAPHVVLITVDTMRADAAGFMNPLAATPTLDALARESAVFSTAFAPIPQTTPSHAAMFTGLHPATLGMDNNGVPLSPLRPTLAHALRAKGWRTAAFVSGFPLESAVSGLARGFDVYDDVMTDPMDARRPYLVERRAVETTDRALSWLRGTWSGTGGASVFLWIHYYDPHLPYRPPEKFVKDRAPVPPFLREYFKERGGQAATADSERGRALYYGEVTYVDSEIRRLLDVLRSTGAMDNTILVVTSDHGESLGEHDYFFDHGENILPPSMHVPLLIRTPQRVAARLSTPVSVVSLAPTLAALAGVNLPWTPEAPSLVSRMQTPTEPVPATPVFFYNGGIQSRRPGLHAQFGLVHLDPSSRARLFYAEEPRTGKRFFSDLSRDPLALAAGGVRSATEEALLKVWKAEHAGAPAPEAVLTEEERAKLKSLGYL